jgi:hypothetical protein
VASQPTGEVAAPAEALRDSHESFQPDEFNSKQVD